MQQVPNGIIGMQEFDTIIAQYTTTAHSVLVPFLVQLNLAVPLADDRIYLSSLVLQVRSK